MDETKTHYKQILSDISRKNEEKTNNTKDTEIQHIDIILFSNYKDSIYPKGINYTSFIISELMSLTLEKL